jgi:3-hydroxyisobutyrate dehydrogenase-like beta-hydroxyacid dehydrogenase
MEGDHLKPSIGFIGIGHMGSHMVQRLLDAGYPLTVYDRTREKAFPLYLICSRAAIQFST